MGNLPKTAYIDLRKSQEQNDQQNIDLHKFLQLKENGKQLNYGNQDILKYRNSNYSRASTANQQSALPNSNSSASIFSNTLQQFKHHKMQVEKFQKLFTNFKPNTGPQSLPKINFINQNSSILNQEKIYGGLQSK